MAVCEVCGRDPLKVNSETSECSHVDCTSRKQIMAGFTDRAPLLLRGGMIEKDAAVSAFFEDPERAGDLE